MKTVVALVSKIQLHYRFTCSCTNLTVEVLFLTVAQKALSNSKNCNWQTGVDLLEMRIIVTDGLSSDYIVFIFQLNKQLHLNFI